jgi:hypothetical protein
MAHMNQERKSKIAQNLKPILKKYGIKASLAVRNHSSIVLNIKSGTIDFIGNFNSSINTQRGDRKAEGSIDVNPYWYQEHFSGVAKEFLTEAMTALKSADWYDKSDIQSDYFNVAYYVDINVGKWDKPYQFEDKWATVTV